MFTIKMSPPKSMHSGIECDVYDVVIICIYQTPKECVLYM